MFHTNNIISLILNYGGIYMENNKLPLAIKFKWIFRIAITILFFYYLITNKDYNNINYITNCILILFCSILPDVILKLFKSKMSNSADLFIQIFIFLSMLLGRMYNMYSIIPWWDLFLHFLSGILLGLIALAILKPLVGKDIFKNLPPLFTAIYIFIFTIAVAALWEYWEFAGDRLLGFDSQMNSLVDTMTDMLMGTLSGLIITIMSFFHFENQSFKFLDGFVNAFSKLPKEN